MTELLTSAQMRALERAATEGGGVSGRALMERAGAGVVEAILAEWPGFGARGPSGGGVRSGEAGQGGGAAPAPPGYLRQDEGGRRAVVLCGPGNNGGDGFVVARLLHGSGWAVEVFLFGEAGRLPPDARAMHDLWRALGPVRDPRGRRPEEMSGAALVVDALFGTGLARPVSGEIRAWLAGARALDRAGTRVVAVDMPSGLCADSGRVLGEPVPAEEEEGGADLTVSFHRPRPGHFLGRGPLLCGRLRVVEIGLGPLPGGDYAALVSAGGLGLAPGAAAGGSRPPGGLAKSGRGHKFDHGHAVVVSGPAGQGGAARMAARGALRIGAGLVTLASGPGALAEHAARLDAVMLRPVAGAPALARMLEDRRIGALCLGPGLGTGAREAGLAGVALASGRRLVLDADALTLIGRDAALFGALHGGCVLTPHGGEFARLFPDLAARLAEPAATGPAFSKLDACRAAAARAGCVVLFKGADTVIAAPEGACRINAAAYDRAAPWLATAGSGDVLAGFIAGLLARGFSPFDAACTGAWLHVECARSFGPGLIAEDLPETLPKVLRGLGL
ncbi:NAD(P)H-hydrate dehydratase [Pseudogemmobacter sonorensis]|uniref:NAD(P)H-hydrate dehydratase n=1 Tax=Pseudogemmobacter sonorensis TaxID=2989681 RepID=UPI0036B8710D